MDFYGALSRYYDEVFPAGEAEMRFVASLLVGRRHLLDIGCGTGNKTVSFAEAGRRIEAFDNDPGMIARAETDHAAPGLRYRTLDMLRLDEAFPPAAFDACLCLGNTLAHLVEPGAVERFLAAVARRLTPDGVFIAQILNYDRILDRDVAELPTIATAHTEFRRRYAWREGQLRFLTELRVKTDGAVHSGDTPLLPLRRVELAEGLAAAGFDRVDYFGGYDGAPLTADSFHLIAAAYR